MMKFKLILLGFLFLIFAGVYFYLTGDYSDGFRAGTVMKLSRKGYVLKTYEGQLNLGMILNPGSESSTSVNNVWEFSVNGKDKGVIDSLESALTTGQRVRLHYKEKYRALPWIGETRYLIYKVDFAQK